ncbi:MAG TPA: 8-oxo-dGTP diphosphatase [Spirochaetia bacterium]|nr:8-oxo-dGTP diphosphatase [Spirochaetia bacterium]
MTGSAPRRVSEIDWQVWQPTEKATLLFILQESRILLIHKKTGLGAGKINGPGGRIDPGETALHGAIREVQEELCVTPTGVRAAGELHFQFVDGYSLHGSVFVASGFEGTLCETSEAAPLWTPLDRIPYERMWADDPLWLPMLIEGKGFRGFFVFDGDTMLDSLVHPIDG